MLKRLIALTTLPLLFAVAPSVAQNYDGTIGYGGGGMMFTDFNSGGADAALGLETGWVANAHVEHWINRGRVGGRVNAAYTRRQFDSPERRDVDIWIVGGDLLLRLAAPTSGRTVAPFIAAGGGMISYGLGGSEFIVGGSRYPGDKVWQGAVSGGFGIDILPGFTIFGVPSGIRLEVIDHMVLNSPFEPFPGGADYDPVHNVRASLSLMGLVQVLR